MVDATEQVFDFASPDFRFREVQGDFAAEPDLGRAQPLASGIIVFHSLDRPPQQPGESHDSIRLGNVELPALFPTVKRRL